MFQVCVRDLFDFALAFVRSWPLIFELEGRESGFGPWTSDSRTVRQNPCCHSSERVRDAQPTTLRSTTATGTRCLPCSHCACLATDFGSMSNLAVVLKMASLRLSAKGLRIGQIGPTNLRDASVVILNPVDPTGPTINMPGHSADTRLTNQVLCGRWIGTR